MAARRDNRCKEPCQVYGGPHLVFHPEVPTYVIPAWDSGSSSPVTRMLRLESRLGVCVSSMCLEHTGTYHASAGACGKNSSMSLPNTADRAQRTRQYRSSFLYVRGSVLTIRNEPRTSIQSRSSIRQCRDVLSSHGLAETSQLGPGYLVGARDLQPGEMIMSEEPLVVGPCQGCKPMCLGCYKLLVSDMENMARPLALLNAGLNLFCGMVGGRVKCVA
uniref:Uncharacterized protein n=1 Tax=Timema cristinae TaxID=61476 RepID=A0A7R9CI85_TIMCR|nr:unnamed protein product [Timema cristinae]